MLLSEIEKEIIRTIKSNKIKEIYDFVEIYLHPIKSNDLIRDEYLWGEIEVSEGSQYWFFTDNESALRLLASFIILIEKLHKEELIFLFRHGAKYNFICCIDDKKFNPFFDFMQLFRIYSDIFIFPTNDLNTFIENNFITKKERQEIKEQDFREKERVKSIQMQDKSFHLTRKIGYASIFISSLIAITSMTISYITFTKERTVKITNTEPTKVQILNTEVQNAIDSMQSNQRKSLDSITKFK